MEITLSSILWQFAKKSILALPNTLYQLATKALLYNYYEISNNHYINRIFRQRWHKLGDNISFALHFPYPIHDTYDQYANIIIRNESKFPMELATICISAESADCIFQDRITIENLTDKPVIKTLTSIPECYIFIQDGKLVSNYSYIKISLSSLKIDGKTITSNDRLHITPFLSNPIDLDKKFIKKWDSVFNIELITSEKENLYIKARHTLIPEKGRLLMMANWNVVTFSRLLLFKYAKIIDYIISRDIFISIIFWPLLLFGKINLSEQPFPQDY